jgi:phosphohistidine phosphatase
MKTVFFARHAKSNWNEPGISDFERPLNQKGEEDAPVMATYLRDSGFVVEQIISSDAARALATAKVYKKQLTPNQAIIQKHAIYLASYLDIDSVLKQISEQFSRIMIVGHNPTMTDIINYYAADSVQDMSACGVAVVEFEIENWIEIKMNSGALVAYEYPKKIQTN